MKMSLHEFCEYVETNIVNYIDEPENQTVKIEEVVKPNDIVLHGLSVRASGNLIGKLIYLDQIYENIDETTDLEAILISIADCIKTKAPVGLTNQVSFEYEDIKDKLEFAVVDEMLNRKRLENLAVLSLGNGLYATFRIVVLSDDNDRFSIAITKDMVAANGYNISKMFTDAGNNMRRKYPTTFTSMDDVIYEIATGERVDRPLLRDVHKLRRKSGAYTLTNVPFRFGAYNFWIGNTQKKIADLLNRSYYVIPSSINEIIINPIESSQSAEELGAIVGKMNKQIDPDEVLSYKVFLYDRRHNKLTVAFDPEQKESWNDARVS